MELAWRIDVAWELASSARWAMTGARPFERCGGPQKLTNTSTVCSSVGVQPGSMECTQGFWNAHTLRTLYRAASYAALECARQGTPEVQTLKGIQGSFVQANGR